MKYAKICKKPFTNRGNSTKIGKDIMTKPDRVRFQASVYI